MKNKLLIIASSFILLFCSSMSENKVFFTTQLPQPLSLSTLDSLQGKWINTVDTQNKIEISGRNWYEKYDNNSNYELLSKIYFSDTAINFNDSTTHIFDTSSINGRYFIFKNLSDTTFECNYINGFNITNLDTTFSFRPIGLWKISSISVFKKVQ